MTAASGADCEPGWVHDPDDVCVRPCCGPTLPASGVDQPTLRDQLAEAIGRHLPTYGAPDSIGCSNGCLAEWEPDHVAGMLLPLIEADRERAKAEGGAEALEQAADEDDVVMRPDFPGAALLRVVKVADLRARAAALRGSTGDAR